MENIFEWGKKQRRRRQLRDSQRKGRTGEEIVRWRYETMGYKMERTGKGSDFKATKRDWLTGRVAERKHIEVKTGKAKLSELQRKTKKKKRNYKVERVDPLFY